MLFNSFEFIVFLVIVFLIYWTLNRKKQNIFLIICSYIFYGWWDWRFLILIVLSSLVDFIAGKKIYCESNLKKRKLFLLLSIFFNLSVLGFFKYYNFFVDSMYSLLTNFGLHVDSFNTLSIILPVGISFYTFQTMSYSIEIYQRKIKPVNSLSEFFAFVAFFPQLVAGPIERASNLLVQFGKKRFFKLDQAIDGCRQMLWGFFKKIVIADTLAMVVNNFYGDIYGASSGQLLIATLFFAFQIYCDFSGYSDIAIGGAKLFGFRLRRNFNYPYFSRNIAEFWQRWHISLSTWFRDYVFIPLGGSKVSSKMKYLRNILIVFTISGLWHGANWTFIFWGFLNGIYYIPYIFLLKARTKYKGEDDKKHASLKDLPAILTTFLIVLFAWIFFRAGSLNEAFYIINKIVVDFLSYDFSNLYPKRCFAVIFFLLVVEWMQRKQFHPLKIDKFPRLLRWSVYYFLIIATLLFGVYDYNPFIYFQF